MCKRTLAILFVVLILLPSLAAQTKSSQKKAGQKHPWANVEKLKKGTLVRIDLQDGSRAEGRISSADESEVELVSCRMPNALFTPVCTIDRSLISRVARGPIKLPDPRQWEVAGALIGTVAMAIDGAAVTHSALGTIFYSGTGAVAGMLTGLFAAAYISLAKVMTVAWRLTIYEAPLSAPQPMPSPSS